MTQQSGGKQGVALLILRAVVGIIFVAHGWPKLMNGASGTAQFFGQAGIPVPGLSAWIVTLLEVFGGLALIAGAAVTVVSALFIVHMTLGILIVHLPNGFYVIGPGQGGVEFNLLLIASLLTLILVGSGTASVDEMLAGRREAGAAGAPGGGGVPGGGTEPDPGPGA